MFLDLQIKIVTSHTFLGGILGNSIEKRQLVIEKIDTWIYYVQKELVKLHKKVFKQIYNFYKMKTEGFNEEHKNFKTAIHQNFTPNIFTQ